MTQNITSAKQNNDPTNHQAPFVLALDVGTSSTRALLFDATGTAIPHIFSQLTYELTTTSAGEVSVDADKLTSVVAQAIDEALKLAGPMAVQIAVVAMDTFWHSLIAVDAAGHPLTPVITWEDTRPYSVVAELGSILDEKAVHDRTGARFHASYWPAKLRCLAKERPDLFERTAQWLSFGEYLHRKFLGKSVCSLSMASGTGMLATRARTWDQKLIKALGVKPEQMPKLGDIGDRVCGLTQEYAERWPVLKDVPWFPAVGDGAAACIGSGATSIENWALTVGTSSAMRVVVSPEKIVPSMGLWLYLIDAKRGVLGGALSEGGNMLKWLERVLKIPSLKEAEPLIATLQPDEHGLTILPFISGERSPGWHTDAHMTISGITTNTTAAQILRASMEALAYRLDAVFEELCLVLKINDKTPRLYCSGGVLFASQVLQQIIADTLGVSLYPSLVQEASARGAALLALEALDILSDAAQIPPNLKDPIKPDPVRSVIYKKASMRQHKLYEMLLSGS